MALNDAHMTYFKTSEPAMGFALEYRAGMSKKMKSDLGKVKKAVQQEKAEASISQTMGSSKKLADILPKPKIADASILYRYEPHSDEPTMDEVLAEEPVPNPTGT
jgi:hypothetical protein